MENRSLNRPFAEADFAPSQSRGHLPALKTIVLATDFSACSTHAFSYAAWLAQATGARLRLFHSVGIPNGSSDMLVNPISLLEKIAGDRLQSLAEAIPQTILDIEYEYRSGFPAENIVRYADEVEADLLIVGAKGISNGPQWLSGSTNGEVLRRANCTVLAIPQSAAVKPFQNVVLAVDLEEALSPKLQLLFSLVEFFDARLQVLHVIPPREHFSPSAYEAFKLDFLAVCPLDSVEFHLFETDNHRVAEAIQDYAAFEGADLVAMTTRPRSLLASLFQRSESRWMTLKSEVPMWILKPYND